MPAAERAPLIERARAGEQVTARPPAARISLSIEYYQVEDGAVAIARNPAEKKADCRSFPGERPDGPPQSRLRPGRCAPMGITRTTRVGGWAMGALSRLAAVELKLSAASDNADAAQGHHTQVGDCPEKHAVIGELLLGGNWPDIDR